MTPYPNGANRYAQFLKSIQMSQRDFRVNEPEPPFIPELELQAMWFGGELGRKFDGTRGEIIEIRDFGHWNHAAGPDFTEVSVSIDGEIRTGSLEIDLDCRSWEDHGHGANREFDDVVLHLFINPTSREFYTRNSQHRQIAQAQLPRTLLNHARVRELPEAHPGRCLPPLKGMPDAAIASLLESAAQYRIRAKASRIQAMTAATSKSQALFQLFSEALGYRKNRLPMAILAQRNPINDLLRQSREIREARLFGCSGFIDTVAAPAPQLKGASSEYLKQLWHEWWKLRTDLEPVTARKIDWCLGGFRPINHPQRRIAALVTVLCDWRKFEKIWNQPSDKLVSQWLQQCGQLSHPFWDKHFTLKAQSSSRPMKLIGQGRARDILGNVIFPMLISDNQSNPSCWEAYLAMIGSDENQKLRRAALRLFGEDAQARKRFTRFFYQQQALLQIFQDFCLVDDSGCAECPFPEQLQQWNQFTPSSCAIVAPKSL